MLIEAKGSIFSCETSEMLKTFLKGQNLSIYSIKWHKNMFQVSGEPQSCLGGVKECTEHTFCICL